MESIPVPPSDDYAHDVYGLSWKRIFKLRNAVARKFYRKFEEQIPLEEFLSEGNQALTESLAAFDPTGTASLATWLYRQLSRRMWTVVSREWRGTNETLYATRGKHAKRLKIVYKAPQLDAIPEDSALHTDDDPPPMMPAPLTIKATQEALVYLHQCLGYVDRHTNQREQVYLWHSVDGDDCAAIGRQYQRDKSDVQRALHKVRHRLTTWADEVSYAAAD